MLLRDFELYYKPTYIALSCPEIDELQRKWDRLVLCESGDDKSRRKSAAQSLSDNIDEVIAKYPHQADMYHLKALQLAEGDDIDGAIEALHKAANLNDLYHPLIHFLGSHIFLDKADTLLKLGHKQEAEADYKHAVFLEHENMSAIDGVKGVRDLPHDDELADYSRSTLVMREYHAQVVLSDKGYLFEAVETAGLTAKEDIVNDCDSWLPQSELVELHDAAYSLMLEGKLQEAEEGFLALLEKYPDCRFSWHKLGQIRVLDGGRLEEALLAFKEADKYDRAAHKAYHDDAAWHFYNRGCLYLRLGDMDMAINDFSKAFNLDKFSATALRSRAELWIRKGAQFEARRDILMLEKAGEETKYLLDMLEQNPCDAA